MTECYANEYGLQPGDVASGKTPIRRSPTTTGEGGELPDLGAHGAHFFQQVDPFCVGGFGMLRFRRKPLGLVSRIMNSSSGYSRTRVER